MVRARVYKYFTIYGTNFLIDKADADGMGQRQEAELSEDMMEFAFAMGE